MIYTFNIQGQISFSGLASKSAYEVLTIILFSYFLSSRFKTFVQNIIPKQNETLSIFRKISAYPCIHDGVFFTQFNTFLFFFSYSPCSSSPMTQSSRSDKHSVLTSTCHHRSSSQQEHQTVLNFLQLNLQIITIDTSFPLTLFILTPIYTTKHVIIHVHLFASVTPCKIPNL